MTERVDVAVVGAGPAGCAAAAQVLQHRPAAHVVLLDRADFPRDKPCGDGIAGEVIDLLEGLGLDAPTLVGGYRPATRLRIRAPRGVEVDRPLRTPAYVIPRMTFDARLVEQVQDRGAVLVRHRVRTVRSRPDVVDLDGRFEAAVVIGADGAESTVRRALTGQALPRRSVAVAIRGYAPELAGHHDTQLLAMSTHRWPAYAWSFPIGDGSANVGYGEPLRRRGVSRNDLLAGLQSLLPGVQPDPRGLRAHRLPLSTGRPHIPDGRVLLAGDAQALVNPLTGEGIFYAVRSGALAGACSSYGADAGRAYRSAMRIHLARYLRHVGALARASRWPGLMDAGVAAAARDQGAFDDVVDLGLVAGHVTSRLAV
jgi:menaquinone-9 beta-reductase